MQIKTAKKEVIEVGKKEEVTILKERLQTLQQTVSQQEEIIATLLLEGVDINA